MSFQEIRFVEREQLKEQPRPGEKLGFGSIFSDYMFMMDYETGKGWYDPRIVPYGPLSLEPSAMVLHYGQALFEGMKAYRQPDGSVRLFRPLENFRRANHSAERMYTPEIEPEFMVHALQELIKADEAWVPSGEGETLYIRPFVIASDPHLGVRAADHYLFIIIMSPSGAYYATGLNPVPIAVESEYVRAVRGGTGEAKTPGNYASSLKAQELAAAAGYQQVLWLDGVERRYIEEVGSMNVFFVINDQVVTPKLNGSILPGITRRSVIELLADEGVTVEERLISIDELIEALDAGEVDEIFGTGTAAVISPVGKLLYKDKTYVVNNNETGRLSQHLYDEITGFQFGTVEDRMDWTVGLDQ